jgi:peptidylprolyl isomerase
MLNSLITRPKTIIALLSVGLLSATAAVAIAAHPHASKSHAGKVVTTKSGLKYVDVVVGKGAQPHPGQTVTVDYVGKLTNGTVFDASKNHGGTFQFVIGEGQVIKGWDQGVMSMRVGGERKLIIPPALGYGAAGAGGVIPPNATLIFQVKLLGVH